MVLVASCSFAGMVAASTAQAQTPAETGAVDWAVQQIGSTAWPQAGPAAARTADGTPDHRPAPRCHRTRARTHNSPADARHARPRARARPARGFCPDARADRRTYASSACTPPAPISDAPPATSVDPTTAASNCYPSRDRSCARAHRSAPQGDGSPPTPHRPLARKARPRPFAARTQDSLHHAGTLLTTTTPSDQRNWRLATVAEGWGDRFVSCHLWSTLTSWETVAATVLPGEGEHPAGPPAPAAAATQRPRQVEVRSRKAQARRPSADDPKERSRATSAILRRFDPSAQLHGNR